MKLNQLIDVLHNIELRYPGESIEVNAFDEDGYMTDIQVHTEIVFAVNRKRVMIRGIPLEESDHAS